MSSLVRSAINISNQYQSQFKPNESQFSPQNSDLLSNSSSNLKSHHHNTNHSDKKASDKQKKLKKVSKKSKSNKKKKSSSSENVNRSPASEQSPTNFNVGDLKTNLIELNNSSGNFNINKADSKSTFNYSQLRLGADSTNTLLNSSSLNYNNKRALSAKRPANMTNLTELGNFLNNESLRWHNELENNDEEQKRIEQYKMNRRKRYLDQKNIQLLATLSKAKSILSSVNTPVNPTIHIQQDDLDAQSSRFSMHTQDILYAGSANVSKITLNDNSSGLPQRISSSKSRKFSTNDTHHSNSVEFVEINNLNLNVSSNSLLPSRPKSEKSFHSTSFMLNTKRPHVNDTLISSITSNS